jgi:hypothetical protein
MLWVKNDFFFEFQEKKHLNLVEFFNWTSINLSIKYLKNFKSIGLNFSLPEVVI